jgi:hypothetical protein
MMKTEMAKEMGCCATEQIMTPGASAPTTIDRVRSLVLSPRGLTVSGIVVVAIGLALNWSWLVAFGAAPIILALAPCAVMCAFGLCMNMGGHAKPSIDKPGAGSATGGSSATPTRADGVPS